jgi:hypothetical protein
MANALYDPARQLMLKTGIDWDNNSTATFKAILLDTGQYTVDLTNHQYVSSVPAGARIKTATMTNRSIVSGAADADDTTFTAVPAGSGTAAIIEAIALYKDTGNEATSPLIAYIDSATGLPITPNGGDIIVVWDNGVNRIFKP